jgi:VWFA-related protein
MTGRRSAQVVLLLVSLIAYSHPSSSQEQKKQTLEHQISVSGISIAVTVQGGGGRYITDLEEKDFTVFENDVKQAITYFKHDYAAPVSLTVLLDVSGSMGLQDKLMESKAALKRFLTEILSPQDEVSLLIFADGEVEVASTFSTDKAGFVAVLERTDAYGQTALNDAVAVSPEFANRGKNEKRALLLITDGIENDSQGTVDQALQIARRVDVPIFAVGYKIPLGEQFLKKYKRSQTLTSAGIISALERFSRATGGKLFLANQPGELGSALGQVKRELSHQYIIGYTSYKDSKSGYRKIRVVTSNKRHKVRTREGY